MTLDLGEGVKMEFVLIPAGTFSMGDPKEETGPYHEEGKPQHQVTLSKAYYLGKYEVTQAQYERITGTIPIWVGKNKVPEFPVARIRWQECADFCKKLGEKTGGKARLPTEAEWEYACRAGTRTRFSFGNEDAKLVDYGWIKSNSGGKKHPVGQKMPNPWGLYDMHGSLREWCQDWYGPYTEETATDPKGAATGNKRVLRGGSVFNLPGNCRSAIRSSYPPAGRNSSHGLRILLDF